MEPVVTSTVVSPFRALLKDREFQAFQDLVYRLAGIRLSDAKRALLVGRLSRRLRALGLASFGDYYEYVTDPGHEDELVVMLDCLSTNETRFFREPKQFEFLEAEVFPAWLGAVAQGQRSRHIRVWSAACSTGEEPYSLAMLLLYHFPPTRGWTVEVLASDLSTRVLDISRRGIWSIERAPQIPERLRKLYMLRGTSGEEGRMAAGPELRSVLSFRRLNLNDDRWPLQGTFDLLFVRNVFIYFDAASRRRVVERMLRYLGPNGVLFLGHAESLSGVTESLRSVAPTIYTWATEWRRSRGTIHGPRGNLLSAPIFAQAHEAS